MNPLFQDASHVLVDLFEAPKAVDAGQVKPGDIVLYKENRGEWVCHRCLDSTENGLLLKGDANTTMEFKENIFVWGVVRGFVRGNDVFEVEPFFATRWLCSTQRRQCEAKSYLVRKLYRAASLLLLFLHKVFSIRKQSHLKS